MIDAFCVIFFYFTIMLTKNLPINEKINSQDSLFSGGREMPNNCKSKPEAVAVCIIPFGFWESMVTVVLTASCS